MFENILHEFGHYVNSNDVTIMPGTWYLYSSTGGKVTFKVWIGRVIQIRAARVSSLTLNTTTFMLLVTTRFIGSWSRSVPTNLRIVTTTLRSWGPSVPTKLLSWWKIELQLSVCSSSTGHNVSRLFILLPGPRWTSTSTSVTAWRKSGSWGLIYVSEMSKEYVRFVRRIRTYVIKKVGFSKIWCDVLFITFRMMVARSPLSVTRVSYKLPVAYPCSGHLRT